MDKPRSFAPIIAVVLLLLPVLYVGSYLALVLPGDYAYTARINNSGSRRYVNGYRCFGDRNSWKAQVAPTIYWPLEHVDRKLRPVKWESKNPLFDD